MPDRREFLEGVALAATPLPSAGASPADGDEGAQPCAVCGADKPASMVTQTTVAPIAPLQADICAVCQFVQDHALPDGVCDQCGDAVDPGFSIELEYPLGEAGLPAFRAGTLCGDCAAWIASDIAYRSVDADPESKQTFRDLIDAENERLAALGGSA